jgi:hypothetical protein
MRSVQLVAQRCSSLWLRSGTPRLNSRVLSLSSSSSLLTFKRLNSTTTSNSSGSSNKNEEVKKQKAAATVSGGGQSKGKGPTIGDTSKSSLVGGSKKVRNIEEVHLHPAYDYKYWSENVDMVTRAATDRRTPVNIHEITILWERKRALDQEKELLNRARNARSDEFHKASPQRK